MLNWSIFSINGLNKKNEKSSDSFLMSAYFRSAYLWDGFSPSEV